VSQSEGYGPTLTAKAQQHDVFADTRKLANPLIDTPAPQNSSSGFSFYRQAIIPGPDTVPHAIYIGYMVYLSADTFTTLM